MNANEMLVFQILAFIRGCLLFLFAAVSCKCKLNRTPKPFWR